MKALVTSCASISQNCAAPAATNSAEKITAPLTGLIASSATFAGVGSTSDRASAIAQVRRFEPAVVTMDLGLPPQPDDPTEGLRLLEEIHGLAPNTKIIVLTGQNDRANALKAIGRGAHDFCTKPFEPELLTWTIEGGCRVHSLN